MIRRSVRRERLRRDDPGMRTTVTDVIAVAWVLLALAILVTVVTALTVDLITH
jgi:hypothetical protein